MTMKSSRREIAVVAITKNGIEIAKKLQNAFDNVDIFVPLNLLMLIYLLFTLTNP